MSLNSAFTPPSSLHFSRGGFSTFRGHVCPNRAGLSDNIDNSHGLTTSRATRQRIQPLKMGLFDMWKSDTKDPNAPPKFGFDIGYAYLAHPEKDTGEDAFFVEGTSIGVFDGVSGASETRGVDPRLYSQRLAAETSQLVKDYGPSSVVKAALEAAISTAEVEIGASTACVVGMDNVGRIFGINLGDSGVRLVRNGKLIFRTKEQLHFFNCPYQLGTDSEDSLAMGQNVQTRVKEGDILVVASDGLYDNMSDDELVQMISIAEDSGEDCMSLAEQLGDLASTRGVDKTFSSPFMQAAIKSGVAWEGGKADDITVVIARVIDGSRSASESLLSTIPESAAAE